MRSSASWISRNRGSASRGVLAAAAFAVALALPPAAAVAAKQAFDALAFTHRKEYAVWVAEAKQPATRARRVGKTVEMLRAGVKHP